MSTQILKLLFEYIDARIAELHPDGDGRDVARRMEAEDALLSICPETRDP